MIKVWKMFFNFCKFMIYLLTESDSDEEEKTIPLYIKNVVYELLLATVYFLQKTEFRLDLLDYNIDENNSVNLVIENLLSCKISTKPSGFINENVFSFAIQNVLFSKESENSSKNNSSNLKTIDNSEKEEINSMTNGSSMEDSPNKINPEVYNNSEGIENLNLIELENTDSDHKIVSFETREVAYEKDIDETRNSIPDSIISSSQLSHDELLDEIKMLPEIYEDIKELRLDEDELNDTLVKELEDKVINKKQHFEKYLSSQYQDSCEYLFGEIKTLTEFSNNATCSEDSMVNNKTKASDEIYNEDHLVNSLSCSETCLTPASYNEANSDENMINIIKCEIQNKPETDQEKTIEINLINSYKNSLQIKTELEVTKDTKSESNPHKMEIGIESRESVIGMNLLDIDPRDDFKINMDSAEINCNETANKLYSNLQLLNVNYQNVPNITHVNVEEKKTSSVEELKKITDFLLESDEDGEVDTGIVNEKFQEKGSSRSSRRNMHGSNKLARVSEKKRICISKFFKSINHDIRTHKISDGFYCRPCDMAFVSSYKWKVHCSHCRLHQCRMEAQESENFEVECKHCNFHVILSLNFIEPYMKYHLRVHKIYNETYKITTNGSEQIHYNILTDDIEKLKNICKNHPNIQRTIYNSNVKKSEVTKSLRCLKELKKEVKFYEAQQYESKLVPQNETSYSIENDNLIKNYAHGENNFLSNSPTIENELTATCEEEIEGSMFLKTIDQNQEKDKCERICRHFLSLNTCATCGLENYKSDHYNNSEFETEIFSFIRKTLTERNKKVTNIYLPLFLGICLFCRNGFKTPLEWSHHLQDESHLQLTANGNSISCFKCALIIYGDPNTINLKECLFLSEHRCFL